MTERKPILCLDFDGVLHSYASGWQGARLISDPPVAGAAGFLLQAVEVFEVAILSSRSHQEGGIEAMQAWLWGHLRGRMTGPEATAFVLDRVGFPEFKPAAFVTLDDRAVTFTGQWPAIAELQAFKPWWQK
jgi:hypothetical protein